MGNCLDCAYWDRWRDRADGAGECRKALDTGERESVAADDLGIIVNVCDDHGLESYLVTGPQFGCVKFRPCEEVK